MTESNNVWGIAQNATAINVGADAFDSYTFSTALATGLSEPQQNQNQGPAAGDAYTLVAADINGLDTNGDYAIFPVMSGNTLTGYNLYEVTETSSVWGIAQNATAINVGADAFDSYTFSTALATGLSEPQQNQNQGPAAGDAYTLVAADITGLDTDGDYAIFPVLDANNNNSITGYNLYGANLDQNNQWVISDPNANPISVAADAFDLSLIHI